MQKWRLVVGAGIVGLLLVAGVWWRWKRSSSPPPGTLSNREKQRIMERHSQRQRIDYGNFAIINKEPAFWMEVLDEGAKEALSGLVQSYVKGKRLEIFLLPRPTFYYEKLAPVAYPLSFGRDLMVYIGRRVEEKGEKFYLAFVWKGEFEAERFAKAATLAVLELFGNKNYGGRPNPENKRIAEYDLYREAVFFSIKRR